MQTNGVLAKLRSRLRGDRYMVDAHRPAPVVPAPAPTPAPATAAQAPPKEG